MISVCHHTRLVPRTNTSIKCLISRAWRARGQAARRRMERTEEEGREEERKRRRGSGAPECPAWESTAVKVQNMVTGLRRRFVFLKNKSSLRSLFRPRRFSERPPIYLIALIIFNCAISKQGVHMHGTELENEEPCSACRAVQVSAAAQSSQLCRDKYKTRPQRPGNAKQTLQKRTNIMNIYIPPL